MERDQVEVPLILTKCAEAVEAYGLNTVGIYRLSGVNTQIQKLRAAFDRDCRGVNLMAEEYISDVNNITSLLKLWFRELPDPLFPRDSYQHFLNAASKLLVQEQESERKRKFGLTFWPAKKSRTTECECWGCIQLLMTYLMLIMPH